MSSGVELENILAKLIGALPIKATEIGWEKVWEDAQDAQIAIETYVAARIAEARVDELRNFVDRFEEYAMLKTKSTGADKHLIRYWWVEDFIKHRLAHFNPQSEKEKV